MMTDQEVRQAAEALPTSASTDHVALFALIVALVTFVWQVRIHFTNKRDSIDDHFWFRRTIDQNLLKPLDALLETVIEIQEEAASLPPKPDTTQCRKMIENVQVKLRALFWQFSVLTVFEEKFLERFETELGRVEELIIEEFSSPITSETAIDFSAIIQEVARFRNWSFRSLRDIHRSLH